VNPEANDTLAEFVREKIRARVNDPATAAPLTMSMLWPVASMTRAASALAAPGMMCPAPGTKAFLNC